MARLDSGKSSERGDLEVESLPGMPWAQVSDEKSEMKKVLPPTHFVGGAVLVARRPMETTRSGASLV